MIACRWFTLFAKDFPVDVSSRVWDSYLMEGEAFLYRISLGICLHLKTQLLMLNMEDCSSLLGSAGKVMTEEEVFRVAKQVNSSNRLIREMLHQSDHGRNT